MDFLPEFLRSGDVAVDVGANSADWTSVFSRRVGPTGHVFSFEADPYYADVTAKTIQILGLRNVRFFPFGLSDRKSEAWLEVVDTWNTRVSGTGRVLEPSEESTVSAERRVSIRLESLDDLAQSHPELWKTRIIKADVEGSELMVFRGARRVIEKSRPICIPELDWPQVGGYVQKDVIDFFLALGYESYVAVTSTLLRPSHEAGAIPEGPRSNRIMIPRELPLPGSVQVEAGAHPA
ncbi:MAG TPA: FkbM family methyltransferase [Candidatus Eisenbacteria bacterium]|nr:FkbM family methyltransferase [Candidatus Eisenbacteria bacterium]